MLGLLFRFLFRFFFRFLITALVFVIGNLLSARGARERSRSSDGPRTPAPGATGAPGRPPLDRSNALDVPFTEVPPPGEAAPGSAGDAGRGA